MGWVKKDGSTPSLAVCTFRSCWSRGRGRRRTGPARRRRPPRQGRGSRSSVPVSGGRRARWSSRRARHSDQATFLPTDKLQRTCPPPLRPLESTHVWSKKEAFMPWDKGTKQEKLFEKNGGKSCGPKGSKNRVSGLFPTKLTKQHNIHNNSDNIFWHKASGMEKKPPGVLGPPQPGRGVWTPPGKDQ